MRQMGSPSTSTRIMDSFGSSLVAATRSRTTLVNPGGQFLLDRLSNLGDRKPIEDLPKKPLDQHPLGDGMRDAPALQVEEVLRVHRTDGRAVTATQDVVVQDLEDGPRGCLRLLREEQVTGGLVGGTAARLRLDAHLPDVPVFGPFTQPPLTHPVPR